jgi:hypothetical protein
LKKPATSCASSAATFKAAFASLEERKVVVLNKFLPLEGRINTLIDLLPQLQINADKLRPKAKKCLRNDTVKGQGSTKE